ncbi:GDSL-type esterase/lipase family protein [Streptomyces sp. NPDC007088]|uniref:GDSL-type esterase/lipase family protein n=1 Tax=Streptomyces sp. NPDC007088 TaxID=3364773 RepID=UPI00369668B8
MRRPVRRAASVSALLGSALLLTSPTTAAPPQAQTAQPLHRLFDNRAISSARHPSAADFDGSGRSLSAGALARAGWRPGHEVTVAGARLRLPARSPGQPDNVRADGQRVAVSGRGAALAFLVAATGGPASGRGLVHYTDGSHSRYRLAAPDWRSGPLATKSVALDSLHTPRGRSGARPRLYTVTVPVERGRTVRAVTLPRPAAGGPVLHVFALSVTKPATGWTGSWSAATAARVRVGPWKDRTLRLVVHSSAGGSRVRVRLDNTFADGPVRISGASIAVRSSGASAKSRPRPLRFGGEAGTTLAAGTQVRSDPLGFEVPPDSDLLVSLRLPGTVRSLPVRTAAVQTSYVSADGDEDHTRDRDGTAFEGSLDDWPLLTGVDVAAGPGSVVALGDSTTVGAHTDEGGNQRWTDALSRRLEAQEAVPRYGVLNQGLTANRLLADRYPGDGLSPDTSGVRVASRLDRDLFAQTAPRVAVVYLGLNDLRWGSKASEVIAELKEIARRSRDRGLPVLAATLTPCGGERRCTPAVEAGRREVNSWLRSGGGDFAGVVDFDRAVTDPARPGRLRPGFDSGDGLHPNAAGLSAMAARFDLGELRRLAGR